MDEFTDATCSECTVAGSGPTTTDTVCSNSAVCDSLVVEGGGGAGHVPRPHAEWIASSCGTRSLNFGRSLGACFLLFIIPSIESVKNSLAFE